MSNWPEAVWIVKKLQKNFDFVQQINFYTQNLNNLNEKVNALNNTVNRDKQNFDALWQNINNVKTELDYKFYTFCDTKELDGSPSHHTSNQYSKGTIWLVKKQQ